MRFRLRCADAWRRWGCTHRHWYIQTVAREGVGTTRVVMRGKPRAGYRSRCTMNPREAHAVRERRHLADTMAVSVVSMSMRMAI